MNEKTVNQRITEAREALGLSKAKFAQRLYISPSFLSMMETGARRVQDRTIVSICRTYGISEAWLRDGIGDMMAPRPEREREIDAICEERSLSKAETAFVRTFADLDPKVRRQIQSFILTAAANMSNAMLNEQDEHRPQTTDAEIEEELEHYRRELVAQRAAQDESSVSDGIEDTVGVG